MAYAKKLNNTQLINIYARCRAGNETYQSIADSHNVTKQCIHQLCKKIGLKKKPCPVESKRTCKLSSCNNKVSRRRLYCSTQCKTTALRLRAEQRSIKWSKYLTVSLICTNCSNQFTKTRSEYNTLLATKHYKTKLSDNIFCNLDCYHDWRRKQNAVRKLVRLLIHISQIK